MVCAGLKGLLRILFVEVFLQYECVCIFLLLEDFSTLDGSGSYTWPPWPLCALKYGCVCVCAHVCESSN